MTRGLNAGDGGVWSVSRESGLHHHFNISVPVFVSGRQLSETPHRSLLMNIKRDIFLRVRPLLFIPFIVQTPLSRTLGFSASNLIVRSSACVPFASLRRVDLTEIKQRMYTAAWITREGN